MRLIETLPARILRLVLLAAWLVGPAAAQTLAGFRPGPTQLSLDGPRDLAAAQEVVLEGENPQSDPVVLVLRIDDAQSASYATRFELERTVLPGPFRIRTAPGAWRTPSGRFLDAAAIRRILVNTGYGAAPVRITALRVETPVTLPAGVAALSFGPDDAPVFPGFARVPVQDPRIENGASPRVPIRRSSQQPLIGTGLRGVERFVLPWPNGRWDVSLWTEDPGDWEYLPHPRQRRVLINGAAPVWYLKTPGEWLREVYFAGREAEDVTDPWTAFYARRGGLLTQTVEVKDGRIVVDLAGNTIEATYLSAMLVEPSGTGQAALKLVEAARRERFLEAWPVVGPRAGPAPATLAVGLLPQGAPAQADWRPDAALPPPPAIARGTIGWLDAMVAAPEPDAAPRVTLIPLERNGRHLPAELRWGHWRYTRHNPAAGQLTLEAEQLRGEMARMTLRPGLPRRLNLLVRVPEDAAPGRYEGRLVVESRGRLATVPLVVEVPSVTLPAADRPVGIYHDLPPYAAWFQELGQDARRGMECELRTMRGLGLTGLSPALATPWPGDPAGIVGDLAMAREAGLGMDLLAYTPVKRMVEQRGIAMLPELMQQVAAGFAARGLPAPVWSIADEPGNPGSLPADLERLRGAIRLGDAKARVAGQLNRPADRQLLGLFDVVLLNAGFGIDAQEIQRWRKTGPTPWLYNMPDVEAAAGFHLWRTGAAGYLQWHGRAIGADPFDPTDSGEADVQLYPMQPEACAAVPDLDLRLLQIGRGVADLRWMLWLEAAAARDAGARGLLAELRQEIPAGWRRGEAPLLDMPGWRRRLALLAQASGAR
ncbi:hypothetical protein E2C06_25605 [Dankookia rubra]|uniref:Glycoside hydrolase 123 C-terminal domain-containing protein n=1 Tax=Dankookia rubra TaxID=1442381 RepID=A0A4R5QBK7_9PROT|nr:hypothetical protein [Dankookia rubra]TDH59771.1 hypothetical protein E2C06_25605 [Dankookia rubra]